MSQEISFPYELVRIISGKLWTNHLLFDKIREPSDIPVHVISITGLSEEVNLKMFNFVASTLKAMTSDSETNDFEEFYFEPKRYLKSIKAYPDRFTFSNSFCVILLLATGLGGTCKQDDAQLINLLEVISSKVIYMVDKEMEMNELYDLEFYASYARMAWNDIRTYHLKEFFVVTAIPQDEEGFREVFDIEYLATSLKPFISKKPKSDNEEICEICASILEYYKNLRQLHIHIGNKKQLKARDIIVLDVGRLALYKGTSFAECFKIGCKMFFNKDLKFPQRMSKANASLTLVESKKKALDKYKLRMKRFLRGGLDETIEQYHEVLLSEARDELLASRSFSSKLNVAKAVEELKADIQNLDIEKDPATCFGIKKKRIVESVSIVVRVIATATCLCILESAPSWKAAIPLLIEFGIFCSSALVKSKTAIKLYNQISKKCGAART